MNCLAWVYNCAIYNRGKQVANTIWLKEPVLEYNTDNIVIIVIPPSYYSWTRHSHWCSIITSVWDLYIRSEIRNSSFTGDHISIFSVDCSRGVDSCVPGKLYHQGWVIDCIIISPINLGQYFRVCDGSSILRNSISIRSGKRNGATSSDVILLSLSSGWAEVIWACYGLNYAYSDKRRSVWWFEDTDQRGSQLNILHSLRLALLDKFQHTHYYTSCCRASSEWCFVSSRWDIGLARDHCRYDRCSGTADNCYLSHSIQEDRMWYMLRILTSKRCLIHGSWYKYVQWLNHKWRNP